MKIGGQNGDIGALQRLARKESAQRDGQFGHNREGLCPFDLMRQDRPRSGTQAEGDFSPVGKLGYRREGHGEINRVTKVWNSDGGAELDRKARYDRRGACEYASIFEIVVGPNLLETKFFQCRPRV